VAVATPKVALVVVVDQAAVAAMVQPPVGMLAVIVKDR
jgi:hypothetical protein